MYIIKRLAQSIIRIMACMLAGLNSIVAFSYMSEFLSIIPFSFGRLIRYEYYKRSIDYCGVNVVFPFGVHLSYRDVRIGNNVRLGHFNALGKVNIGDNVLIGAFCFLPSGGAQHGFERTDIPIIQQPGTIKRISIGSDVWIGAHSIIMADVEDGCVIGAGSVVTKGIPSYCVAAGNPAEVIKNRRSNSCEY